jgi:hypothetical protein
MRTCQPNHGHLLPQKQYRREHQAQHKVPQTCELQRDADGISRQRSSLHTFAGLLFGLRLDRD